MQRVFCRERIPEVYAYRHLLQCRLVQMGPRRKGLIRLGTLIANDEIKEKSSNTDCGVCLLSESLALAALLLLNKEVPVKCWPVCQKCPLSWHSILQHTILFQFSLYGLCTHGSRSLWFRDSC